MGFRNDFKTQSSPSANVFRLWGMKKPATHPFLNLAPLLLLKISRSNPYQRRGAPTVKPTVSTILAMIVFMLPTMAGNGLTPNNTFKNPKAQFEVKSIKKFKSSDTILVPTLYLHTLVEGAYTQSNKNAHAKAKYAITNLSPELGAELATAIYQDLIQKLKASGWKVLTYADTKDHPGWQKLKQIQPHKELGVPGFDFNFGHGNQLWMTSLPQGSFLASPIKIGNPGSANLHKIHTKIAKDLGVNLLFPVFRYDGPVAYGTKSRGYKRKSASANIAPVLDLAYVHSGFYSQKAAWGGVNSKESVRVSENIGSILEVGSSQSKDVSLFTFDTFRSIAKGDYQVTLDLDVYKNAILKSATDYNSLLVEALKEAKPNG